MVTQLRLPALELAALGLAALVLTAGLVSSAAVVQAAGPQPSFDCKQARTETEKTICSWLDLINLDRETADAYQKLRRQTSFLKRGKVRRDQTAFLASRTACGSGYTCLRKLYKDRFGVLQGQLGRGGSSG